MNIRKQGLIRIRRRILGLFSPEANDPQQFVVADTDAVIIAIDGREIVRQRSVNGGQMRQGSHQDAIGAQRQHSRGRLALERRKHREVLHVAAKQVDHAQRGLSRAAVRLDEQREALKVPQVAQQSVQTRNIVLADGTFVGIPVGDDGLAERARKLVEHRLGPLDQHRRLCRAGAEHWKFGYRCSYRYRLVRQLRVPHRLNCLECLDLSMMSIRLKQRSSEPLGPSMKSGMVMCGISRTATTCSYQSDT